MAKLARSIGSPWIGCTTRASIFSKRTRLERARRCVRHEDAQGVMRRMPLEAEELVELARERSLRDFNVDECENFLPEDTDCTLYEAAE
jgi:hypothetical protein